VRDDFLDQAAVAALGLAAVGRGVRISRHALLLSPERITLGDHARIDAFCVLSAAEAGLVIGRYVHLGAFVSVLGREAVTIGDFATLSPRSTVFSSVDDFSGATMVGPTLPDGLRGVVDAPVVIDRHAVLCAGAVVLPGVTVGESACVGALSLVKTSVEPFTVVAGVPARVIGVRARQHRLLADRLSREGGEGG
jgi:galactoside O-acetyltransferase